MDTNQARAARDSSTARNRKDGRFTWTGATVCKCGHTIDQHTADRRGKIQPCLADGCECESATKRRAGSR